MSEESSQHEPQQPPIEAGSREDRGAPDPQAAPSTPDSPPGFNWRLDEQLLAVGPDMSPAERWRDHMAKLRALLDAGPDWRSLAFWYVGAAYNQNLSGRDVYPADQVPTVRDFECTLGLDHQEMAWSCIFNRTYTFGEALRYRQLHPRILREAAVIPPSPDRQRLLDEIAEQLSAGRPLPRSVFRRVREVADSFMGIACVGGGRIRLCRKNTKPVGPPLRELRRRAGAFRKVLGELVDGNGRDFMIVHSEAAEVEEILGRVAQSVEDVRSALERYTTQDGMATGSGRSSDKEAEGDDGQAGK